MEQPLHDFYREHVYIQIRVHRISGGGMNVEQQKSKHAILLVLFLMSLNLHLELPVFSPFAASLGATSLMIGMLLGMSSFADMVGNVIAGPFIDRYNKKRFIVLPLLLSGAGFLAHAFVENIGSLFFLRLAVDFILAFLMPAAIALLSSYARNSREQGKNMAVYGIMMTIASMLAPVIGGSFAETIGYEQIFLFIGAGMIVTGVLALFSIQEKEAVVTVKANTEHHFTNQLLQPPFLSLLFAGFTVMFFFGTLQFELPYYVVEKGWSTSDTGKLFGIMGAGSLLVLCMFWIQRISAFSRVMFGLFFVSLCFYQLAASIIPLQLHWTVFLIGAGTGLLLPAIKTWLTEIVAREDYGKSFAILSAVYSLGAIASSFLSGALRSYVSPYFFAFLLGMTAFTLILHQTMKRPKAVKSLQKH